MVAQPDFRLKLKKFKTMTEAQFDFLVETKISSLLKAAADYQNNPDKAKDYIIETVMNISKAAKKFGENSVVNELFS